MEKNEKETFLRFAKSTAGATVVLGEGKVVAFTL